MPDAALQFFIEFPAGSAGVFAVCAAAGAMFVRMTVVVAFTYWRAIPRVFGICPDNTCISRTASVNHTAGAESIVITVRFFALIAFFVADFPVIAHIFALTGHRVVLTAGSAAFTLLNKAFAVRAKLRSKAVVVAGAFFVAVPPGELWRNVTPLRFGAVVIAFAMCTHAVWITLPIAPGFRVFCAIAALGAAYAGVRAFRGAGVIVGVAVLDRKSVV